MQDSNEPADAELIRAVGEGKREAFAALVRRHAASVRRLALTLTSSEATADDVVQDVYLSVWRHAKSFGGEGSARGWLLTITRNAARRKARRRAGEPAAAEPLDELAVCAGWGAASSAPDFERALESRELLRQALARLSPEHQEVVTVIDLEGMSLAEGATLLGLELPALKSRLHRARLRLLGAVKEVSQT